MNKTSKTLVVLTPAFPANEFETVWVRPKQLFIRKLQEDFPALNIIILSFNYPLHKKGIPVARDQGYTVQRPSKAPASTRMDVDKRMEKAYAASEGIRSARVIQFLVWRMCARRQTVRSRSWSETLCLDFRNEALRHVVSTLSV